MSKHWAWWIFGKICAYLFDSPAYCSIFDLIRIVKTPEAGWCYCWLSLRLSYYRILCTSTDFEHILSVFCHVSVVELASMKFLIHSHWMTLWWNWVILTLRTSKHLLFEKLLWRRSTDEWSVGRDTADPIRSYSTTGRAEERILVRGTLITSIVLAWSEKGLLGRRCWLLRYRSMVGVGVSVSKVVLYYHMRCDVDFRLRIPVHLSTLTFTTIMQLVASSWVFGGYLLSILVYDIRPYLLVSLLIIDILWNYTFIWLLLVHFFAFLILRPRNPWRCKTWVSENRFFVTLAIVWGVSRGSVGATPVR